MEKNTSLPQQKTAQWIALGLAVVVIGGLVTYLKSEQAENEQIPTAQAPQGTSDMSGAVEDLESSAMDTGTAMFKNGTYTTDGTYASPAGNETIGVTLSVENDRVTSVHIENKATGISENFVKKFSSGIEAQVVGKKLSEVKVDHVSGSSLTPIGFMNALSLIKEQAKS